VFPPPTVFFPAREVDTNLGYVWYRKDAEGSYAIGIKQADHEDDVRYLQNFALYNAPPGTEQRMGTYFYLSPDNAAATRAAVLAFTRNDTFAPIPGYKTMVNHFHLQFTDRLRESGSLDTQTPDLAAMKALGLNIIGLSDFHADNCDSAIRVQGASRISATTSKPAAAHPTSISSSRHGRSQAPGSAATTISSIPVQSSFPKSATPASRSPSRIPPSASLPPRQHRRRAAHAGGRGRLLVHGPPAHEELRGYPDAYQDTFARSDRFLGIAFKPGMAWTFRNSGWLKAAPSMRSMR
jgi:hypothetical protein